MDARARFISIDLLKITENVIALKNNSIRQTPEQLHVHIKGLKLLNYIITFACITGVKTCKNNSLEKDEIKYTWLHDL